MNWSKGRLSLAPDSQSVADWVEGAASKMLEGPAATLCGGHSGCDAETRDLPTPHRCQPSEGADMAERTRGPDPVDRWTRDSGVNITPPTNADPVPTTHTSA